MQEKNINEIAVNIRRARKERKMTQEQLANACGINVSNIKKYECGFRNPKIEQLQKIADGLGISVHELTGTVPSSDLDIVSYLTHLEQDGKIEICLEKQTHKKGETDLPLDGSSIRISLTDDGLRDRFVAYMKAMEKMN